VHNRPGRRTDGREPYAHARSRPLPKQQTSNFKISPANMGLQLIGTARAGAPASPLTEKLPPRLSPARQLLDMLCSSYGTIALGCRAGKKSHTSGDVEPGAAGDSARSGTAAGCGVFAPARVDRDALDRRLEFGRLHGMDQLEKQLNVPSRANGTPRPAWSVYEGCA